MAELGFRAEVVIDVGAHHGEFNRLIQSIFSDAKILSLEANPQCKVHLETVEHEICLLGDVEGKIVAFYTAKSGFNTGNSMFRELTSHFRDDNVEIVYMKQRLLDNVLLDRGIKSVDLLKLDVQGAELKVLHGSIETLKHTEFILLEVSVVQYNQDAPIFAEVIGYMNDRGFRVYDLMETTYRGSHCFQVDVLFVRRDSKYILKLGGIDHFRIDDGDRSNILEILAKRRAENSKYSIIDIGSSMNRWSRDVVTASADWCPSASAQAYTSSMPAENVVYFKLDITDFRAWKEIEDYVEKNGKFDFSICTHILEDITCPLMVCKKLEAISKSGYIAFPRKYCELSRCEGPWRGYIHHRWIFTIKDGELLGYPKLSFLDYDSFYDDIGALDAKIQDLNLTWNGRIPLKLINDGFLGPTAGHVKSYYRELEHDDCDISIGKISVMPVSSDKDRGVNEKGSEKS